MWRKLMSLGALALLVTALAACQVEQTEEGELPEVNIEGGELPEYDVDAADVDVGTQTTTVVVPDVDVNPPAEGDQDPPAEEKPPTQTYPQQ